ncbi:MAG: NUDIX domain-containing protein [Candidatus Aenigmarchaeota archaeon]|nr:NUDIX domain-containing protein [Candidatus Aenigmarchaeota archaeon]
MPEFFDVVNEQDKIIGTASRKDCHTKGLLHRSSVVLIMNAQRHLLLQKRSMKKDLYRGWWNESVSGHVDHGETYATAAARETQEELGIAIPLTQLFKIKKEWTDGERMDNEFVTVFLGKNDGPFTTNPNKVAFVQFFPLETIFAMLETEHFTPATYDIFSEIKKRPELLAKG